MIVFHVLFTGCGGKSAASENEERPAETPDSVQPVFYSSLPDTVFESASEIKYIVNVYGDSSDATIDYLGDMYAEAKGAYTFRNGPYRQADFHGRVFGTPDSIIVDWTFETNMDTTHTSFGVWAGGTGWTGQPLYVHWQDSCISRFRQAGTLLPDFNDREIIVGSLCGDVYFLNFETGKPSRNPIKVGNPIKGTPSLDPTMNGNLYVGHGIPANDPFGAVVINLFNHSVTETFDRDKKSWRGWGAYDSSPLRVGQFLFRPGENNTIYKFLVRTGKLILHSHLRYSIDGNAPGIESSMCVYLNYGYTCDNHGNILCVNLNSLKPVWLYKLGDDIDATPVLEVENGNPYLYVGCEIDYQISGEARFVKLDGLTGEKVWENSIEGNRVEVFEKHFDGGFYASALPGIGNCSHLIFSNCVLNTKGQNGIFVAFNKETGSIEYSTPLKYYAWSSPVGYVNELNEMFILTGDTAGNLYIINGLSGEIITSSRIGSNFESSPVVVGNSAVIGSRGKYIFKISLQ